MGVLSAAGAGAGDCVEGAASAGGGEVAGTDPSLLLAQPIDLAFFLRSTQQFMHLPAGTRARLRTPRGFAWAGA